MRRTASNEEIFKFATDNKWLLIDASEGNVVSVFLTPSGNIMEIYFEKNKVTMKALPAYVCK